VRRGEVWDARLDPIEGSEQAGIRPVVVVSRDAINVNLSTIVAVPCTTFRSQGQLYPSRALVRAPDGGLGADSVALGEQVRALAKHRLLHRRGMLSDVALADVEQALIVALDLAE
jgi:mRNA interferase MazF